MRDDELWDAFNGLTLAAEAWTHRAHLRVAWLFLQRYPLEEAHLLLRVGIIRLNGAHGLVETRERGYHETLTRCWLAVVEALHRAAPAADSEAFVEAHAGALTREAPLRHYSREVLMNLRARTVFVEPDLLPFG